MAVILNDADVFQPSTWETLSEDTRQERERCLQICDWAIEAALKTDERTVAQHLVVLRRQMES